MICAFSTHAISEETLEIFIGDAVLNDNVDIIAAFSNRYRSLSSDKTAVAPELVALLLCLSNSARESLSCLITIAEVSEAVDDLPNYDTSEPDGLSSEFY